MSFLDKILPRKQAEVAEFKLAFAEQVPSRPGSLAVRDFAGALRRARRPVIAEVKHRSPSNPEFRQSAPPRRLAGIYQRGGASALSIVTDARHFGTSLDDVAAMRQATDLPVLTKDFIIAREQILAAWAAGADAVLLIARMLDARQLASFLEEVQALGLSALVECHDQQDIGKSLDAGATIIGINNRNLATLTTDLARTPRLLPLVPDNLLRISESGISTPEHIRELAACGADAFLIGHALLESRDPGRKVRELTGRQAVSAVRTKVCGLTSAAEAVLAEDLGADFLGVIFAPSPRQIDRDQARRIRTAVRKGRLCGVFMDAEIEGVVALADACDLDLIQLHGDESAAYCARLAEATGLPLIKALDPVRVNSRLIESYDQVAYFLVDLPKGAGDSGEPDGGSTAVLAAARVIQAAGKDVFIAGGLDSVNVTEALKLRPFAVDVCRGVESSPGNKDPEKLREFLLEVNR